MGKQGPCCHCGVTSTPLWRNGPPDKPVLCNACGSRWRTKGTLANYTPLHARADPDFEDHGISRVKYLPVNKKKEAKLQKGKRQNDNGMVGDIFLDDYHCFSSVMDEDTTNRSSSGSAISNSESSAQFGSADASDLTGPAQSIIWDTTVPSRKRTCTGRPKPSSVEKLTKDLYTLLHKQQSYFSGSSEEDLLFEGGKPLVSAEIVHGSVLMRNPSSIAREEESEASSLSVENKHYSQNDVYSYPPNYSARNENQSNNSRFSTPSSGLLKCGDAVKRDNSPQEKLQIMANRNSPLCDVNLSDVVNYEEFTRQLTNEEQQQLLKYLPPTDAAKHADGLMRMFESPQFKENLNSFQQLLAEGVFDFSLSGAKKEVCRTLSKLALYNLSKSKWVEHYHQLKICKNGGQSLVHLTGPAKSITIVNPVRSRDNQNKNYSDSRTTTTKSTKGTMISKASFENKEYLDNEGSCFSPRSLFALPPEGSSLVFENLNFAAEESSDQDLLLDLRSNSSFPQAELLYPLNHGTQLASTSSSSAHPHFFHH